MNEADLPIWKDFACAALAGTVAHPDCWGLKPPVIADQAAELADAMLKEFIKRREGI